jgi:hypothetical protein
MGPPASPPAAARAGDPGSARVSAAPTRRRRRAVLPLALALLACGDAAPAGRAERFDAAWRTFDARYALFGVKPVDWAALREVHRPRAAAARDDDELAAAVAALLGELRDAHVFLRAPDGSQRPTYVPTSATNFDPGAWRAQAARLGIVARRGWGHGRLGAVPYVYVTLWAPPFAPADLDAWLETVRDAPALVLDLRMNPGGDDALARPVIARFADAERVAFRFRTRAGPGHDDLSTPVEVRVAPGGAWQFTRPVLLLAGRGSASTTEEVVSALREYPHVTVAGERTMGTMGNPGLHDLGNGWVYSVPRWRCSTADGLEVEDLGIPPDVEVPVAAEDRAAGRDPVLEFAERWAASPAPPPAP